jgi:hypothetical protein
MDVHIRIGDTRNFALKHAVLLYQEGNRAFATLHEVKFRPDGPAYLCAGDSVPLDFFRRLPKGSAPIWPLRFCKRTFWHERRI